MKLLSIIIVLILAIGAKSQNIILKDFDNKFKMAELILEKQPTAKNVKNVLTEGITVDSVTATGYYLKYTDKSSMVAYLYKDTERTVYLSFYEKSDNKKLIYDHVKNDMKFIFVASEHMRDYFNNGKISLQISPGMKEGMLVHIEKVN